MKNILVKGLIASSLFASAVFAEGAFVGVFGGYNDNSEMEYKGYGLKSKFDDKMPVMGIKGGYDFGNFRVYEAYQYSFKGTFKNDKYKIDGDYYDIETNWKIHDFITGFDFTPEISSVFKPVLGVYAGFSILDYDFVVAQLQDDKEEGTRGGFIYGAKLGGAFEVAENSEIEVGYKIDQSRYAKVDDIKMKNSKRGAYLGINYKF